MLDSLPLLTLITLSPLLGIIVLLFIPKDNGKWIKFVGIAATIIPLLLCLGLYAAFDRGASDMQFKDEFSWIKVPLNQEWLNETVDSYFYELKFTLGVDGISLPLVLMTALIVLMAALAAVHIKKRWKAFYIWFLILQIGMFGVFLANDLILFFIFFEITLVPTFFLIAIWGYKDRERSANRFLIYNGVGSAIMLVAFLILVATAGFQAMETENGTQLSYSGDLAVIERNLNDDNSYANVEPLFPMANPFYMSDGLKWMLFIMLLIAFGIKLPIFPFHTWMLRVHAEAPPPLVMIHSGILLKMGAYGLIRFGVSLFPEQAQSWAMVLAVLGLINIIYGALLAFVQQEFKLLLAYSSISHMGIVLLGIAAWNEVGWQGAMIQLVSHGFISALFFLLVGVLYERTQTTELAELGGLAKSIPFASGIILVAGLASLGLPGLSGFVGEILSFIGLFGSMPVLAAIGALGIIFTAAYVLRGVLKITFGPMPDRFENIRDARFIEALPMVTLVAFILLIGIYPAVISDPMSQTIQNLMTRIGG